MRLPCPKLVKTRLPLLPEETQSIEAFRRIAQRIFIRKDPRKVIFVGPCSVHDETSFLEYADRLQKVSSLFPSLFLILRVFIEKPRSQSGWKGWVYDPDLNGKGNLEQGIFQSRKLLLELAQRNIPCCMELLQPLLAPYFNDLLTWAVIGARTSLSQIHRELASDLPFPVGFKNDLRGDIDATLASLQGAQLPHQYISVDEQGMLCAKSSSGNRWTHLILRGSQEGPNYDPSSLRRTLDQMQARGLKPVLCVDASHGNSCKDPSKQKRVIYSLFQEELLQNSLIGLMLESHLFPGAQSIDSGASSLRYGVSITDPCMGWEETTSLLGWIEEETSKQICSVQRGCLQRATLS